MIRLNQLSKSVGNFRLSDITLNLDRGTYTVLLGDSGSGKSLLLEILAGIRTADSGTLSVNGVEIQDLPPGGIKRRSGATPIARIVMVCCGASVPWTINRVRRKPNFRSLPSLLEVSCLLSLKAHPDS